MGGYLKTLFEWLSTGLSRGTLDSLVQKQVDWWMTPMDDCDAP